MRGRPLFDRETMQLDAASFDEDGIVDQIDDDIGLGAGGQFHFFVKKPDRLLERTRVSGVEVRNDVRLCSPTE